MPPTALGWKLTLTAIAPSEGYVPPVLWDTGPTTITVTAASGRPVLLVPQFRSGISAPPWAVNAVGAVWASDVAAGVLMAHLTANVNWTDSKGRTTTGQVAGSAMIDPRTFADGKDFVVSVLVSPLVMRGQPVSPPPPCELHIACESLDAPKVDLALLTLTEAQSRLADTVARVRDMESRVLALQTSIAQVRQRNADLALLQQLDDSTLTPVAALGAIGQPLSTLTAAAPALSSAAGGLPSSVLAVADALASLEAQVATLAALAPGH